MSTARRMHISNIAYMRPNCGYIPSANISKLSVSLRKIMKVITKINMEGWDYETK